MKILNEQPPNIADIRAVFDVDKHRPIYAWGVIIYNPHGINLDTQPQLLAHEEMHGVRQNGWKPTMGVLLVNNDNKIRAWWRDYLESAVFRLEEEIPAHRAEYRQLLRVHGYERPNRRRYLTETAKRLRNPLYKYNHLFSFEQAKNYLELDPSEWKG